MALLAIALVSCQPKAPAGPRQDDVAGARAFIEDFYAWYHPDSATSKSIDDVLNERRSTLEPYLAAVLQLDLDCAARNQSICAIDFDPILNSQDPCEKYEVGEAVRSIEVDLVPVFAICGGRRDSIPVVTAMLFPKDSGGWEIINWTYPDGRRLSDILFQYHHKPE